jgi:hypothetical protein
VKVLRDSTTRVGRFKFTVESALSEDYSTITQTLVDAASGVLIREVAFLRDKHVRELLIAAGWTPPKEGTP